MRQGRFITTALVAIAAMAIGPAWAAAAPSSFADDLADSSAGTADASTWLVEPGLVRLKPTTTSENFDGVGLPTPTGLNATPWDPAGTATVGSGSLTVDGAHVNDSNPASLLVAPQTLEFRATFGSAAYQHVGFADTFADAPWAMFSTGDGTTLPVGLYARTLATPGGTPTDTPIPAAVDPTLAHVFRIELTATDVKFYVDNQLFTTPTAAIASPMRPVASDLTVAGAAVTVDWLGMGSLPSTGTFVSQVHDAGDARAVWGALTPTVVTPTGTAVAIQTRSGKTATPTDGTWSDYQPLGTNGAIQSPSGRYIQYSANLTTNNNGTPSLDKVAIAYDIDTTAPSAAVDLVQVTGTTARLMFSSADGDIAGFECSLDSGAFAPCTSPKELTGLAAASHTVSVRGVDKVGNVGPGVASAFSVDSPVQSSSAAATPAPLPSRGSGSVVTVDRTSPKVSVVPRSLRVSKRGTIAVRVGCPATEKSCKITLQLKQGLNSGARKIVTVSGGKTVTVTLQLAKASRRQLAKHGGLKATTMITAGDAAGNKKTTKLPMTLRAPSA